MKRLQIPLLSYHNRILFLRLSISALVLIGLLTSSSDAKLKIAYSDWPGWVAWEIGIQKDWFKKVGVDVEFQWLEYVPSMDAFAAGQVDACCMTNVDALVTGATGKKRIFSIPAMNFASRFIRLLVIIYIFSLYVIIV